MARRHRNADHADRSHDQAGYDNSVKMLKNAHDLKAPLTFSTDADYWVQGKTRGEVAIEFIETWKAAGIPAPDILRAMTTNGYRWRAEKVRGPIKRRAGGRPDRGGRRPARRTSTPCAVRFVMKDGIVFKRDGVVTPEKFFNAGPVKGWRKRCKPL